LSNVLKLCIYNRVIITSLPVGTKISIHKKPETGDRRLETGDWRLETGDRRLETGDWRLETGDWRLETGDWRLETGDWRLETGGWRLETGDWRLETGEINFSTFLTFVNPPRTHIFSTSCPYLIWQPFSALTPDSSCLPISLPSCPPVSLLLFQPPVSLPPVSILFFRSPVSSYTIFTLY
jgi:uncharacterized cupin superfamily protein